MSGRDRKSKSLVFAMEPIKNALPLNNEVVYAFLRGKLRETSIQHQEKVSVFLMSKSSCQRFYRFATGL